MLKVIISTSIIAIIMFIFIYLLSDEHLDKAEKKMIKKIVKKRLKGVKE